MIDAANSYDPVVAVSELAHDNGPHKYIILRDKFNG